MRWSIVPIAVLALVYAMHMPTSAQPFTFERIEPRQVEANIQGVCFLNDRAWTIQLGNVGYWEQGEQQLAIPTRHTRNVASDISPMGELWILNEGREVTICTPSGEELVAEEIYPILYTTVMAALDGDSCLLARSSFNHRQVYVYRVSRTKPLRIDTMDVDSVVSLAFHRNPVSDELFLCMRHNVEGADTTTYRYQHATGRLTPSPLRIVPTTAIDTDGTEYRIRGSQITVRQAGTDVVSVLVDSVTSVPLPTELVGNMNGRLYGTWIYDMRSMSILESIDTGKTFREIARRELGEMPLIDHAAWFDASIAFADNSHELLVVTPIGEVTVIDALPVSSTETFTEASTIPGSDRMVALCSSEAIVTYDAAAGVWMPLTWVNGSEVVQPAGPTLTRSYRSLYATTGTNTYRYDPAFGVMKQVTTRTGGALPRMKGVVATSTDTDLLNFTGLWYGIDADTATPLATNWNQGLTFGATEDWIANGIVLANGDLLAPSSASFEIDADTLFLPVGTAGVRRSTDMGQTWTPSNDGLGTNMSIWSLQLDSQGTIYTLASHDYEGTMTVGKLFKSTDNGHSWQSILGFFPSSIGNPVKLAIADDRLYMCGPTLIMSLDGAQTWTQIIGPWGSAAVRDVVEIRQRRLLVLTTRGVYITDSPVSVDESEAPSQGISVKGLTARYTGGVLTVQWTSEDVQRVGHDRKPGSIELYDLGGRLVKSVPSESVRWTAGLGETDVALRRGTYIVQAGGLAATMFVAD